MGKEKDPFSTINNTGRIHNMHKLYYTRYYNSSLLIVVLLDSEFSARFFDQARHCVHGILAIARIFNRRWRHRWRHAGMVAGTSHVHSSLYYYFLLPRDDNVLGEPRVRILKVFRLAEPLPLVCAVWWLPEKPRVRTISDRLRFYEM